MHTCCPPMTVGSGLWHRNPVHSDQLDFLPAIASTYAHRETTRLYNASLRFLTMDTRNHTHLGLRTAALLSSSTLSDTLKSKTGLMVARAAALRTNINIDGRPLPTTKRRHAPPTLSYKRPYSPSLLRALVSRRYGNKHHCHNHHHQGSPHAPEIPSPTPAANLRFDIDCLAQECDKQFPVDASHLDRLFTRNS